MQAHIFSFLCETTSYVYFEKNCSYFLFQQMSIVNGTAAYEQWFSATVPVYTKFYLFSVLNPEEFLNGTEKMKLREMGPYTFR